MPKGSITEAEAQAAAERLDRAREAGQQLTLFGQAATGVDEARRTRGQGKASSQLRRWLAAQGFAQPEDRLARMAGLEGGDDPILSAMADAERILAWAFDQEVPEGFQPKRPTPAQRLDVLTMRLSEMRRAAEALMPYGLAKVTPDVAAPPAVQVVVMPGGPSQGPSQGPAGPAAAGPGAGGGTPQARPVG
ncbi:MAG TPA: hypothetical protein PKD10_05265, partial [Paracoccaceae bacterium]|nr:hypothetical protein [Paracoccaceae bacterium]